MSKASMWSLMALVAGCLLLLIGLMGLVMGDCPRPVEQFPLPQAHCTAFISTTAASFLLIVGAAVGILIAIIGEGKRVGRCACAAKPHCGR